MSVNYHISPCMNRCRLLAMLLMLALALPMIGQTTYTYKKSKGKSLRDLQTNSPYNYQKQAAHEDRVVIYRQPSSDPFTLWRNAEAFFSYARWYDYTNDKSIPNTKLRLISNGGTNATLSGTDQTDNRGVIWYSNFNVLQQNQANAEYEYNPASNDNQVVYIACDQSSYTDWDIAGNTFTEPTISQRMVFEIRPASEMADRIEDVYTNDKWLEEYDIMAPTDQTIFIGPKYAFKSETRSYPAYFYKSNGSVQQMNTGGFSNYRLDKGDWEVTNSSEETTDTKYVCNTPYYEKNIYGRWVIVNVGATRQDEPNSAVRKNWTKKETVKKTVDYEKIDQLIAGPGWIWLENGQMSSPAIISGQYVNIGSKSQPNTTTYQLIYALGDYTYTTTYFKTKYTTKEIDYTYKSNKWQQQNETTIKESEILPEPSQTTNTNSQNKIYKIAQFKIQYFDKKVVGPISKQMGDFVNNMEIIAEQNFNFDYSENNKIPNGNSDNPQYWPTPLSTEESTYGFYYGSRNDRLGIGGTPNCYFNEYCFVNNGFGWTTNKKLANHVGNDTTYNKETGFALYTDGSQKAGTVFSIDFGADLCPGAKMYFSAWIGDQNPNSYTNGRPIFNFYVEGTDAEGNTRTLATFTTGEFDNQGKNYGWHYILFPLEFGDDIDYEKFSFRIENMAASTQNNDFFLDDVRVYLQRAAISPIQASISDDPSCLDKERNMMLYTRVDCYTDQIELEKDDDHNTRSFYYRWYDKNGQPVNCNYEGSAYSNGLPYGKVTIPSSEGAIQSGDTVSSFKNFDAAYNATSDPVHKFVKEKCLNPNLTEEERYVVYVATPIHVELGQSYQCILASSVNSLRAKADTVTGKEKCTSEAITQIVRGFCIRSEKLGGFVTDDSQANANVSYELSLVSESINHAEGIENKIENKKVSCYFAYWLFGRNIDSNEWHAQEKINDLEDLYGGASYQNVVDAIKAYIGKVTLNDNSVTPEQENLVNRLVSIGALRLSDTKQMSDTSFLVLPLYTSDTISYTVFPVWNLGGTPTKCHDPLTISLYFQLTNEGEEGEQQTFVRNAISFVKSADETLPKFLHNLRPRRVRIPRDSVQKYVQLKMTDPASTYTVKHATLIKTTNPNTTATEPLFKRIESWVAVTDSVKNMPGYGSHSVRFKDLNQLPEGYSYTFRMDYDIHDVDEQLDTTYNGEAFITFMVVPDVLFYNGTYNDGWNDDSKWNYKDLTAKKFVESMVPLHSTKIVVTGKNNRKLAVKPPVDPNNAHNVQLFPVEENAQPYITYDIGYEPYACSEVFLYGEYHAVLGQHYLHTIDENGDTIPPKWTYEAWPNQNNSGWKLFSVPIKGVVLGDMFVPYPYESSDNYDNFKDNNNLDPNELFSVRRISQEPGEAAVDRTVYSFYNSMYNKETKQYLGNGDTKDITTSTWTYATNALNTPITAGFGWALGLMISPEVDPNKIVLIRLPKNDTEYHYFRNNTWVGESVPINREDLGRPMLELDQKNNNNMVITLENYASSKYFLFGNPTFASIDLERLKKANSSIQAFYQTTIDKDNRYLLASAQNPANNTWYTNLTTANAVTGTLPTGEACFIVLNEPANTVEITINPRMLCNSDGSKKYDGYGNPWNTFYPQSSSSAAPAAYADTLAFEPSAIYITATLDSFMSSTSIIDAPDAELELFMLDREKTPFAIYTVADSKALSINHIREGQSRIPLAMYAEKPVNQPLFAFEGEPRYLVEWDLVDIKTGVRQPLYEGLTMRLNMPQDGSVRYYLERSRHGIYTSESKTDAFQTYAYGGMLTIYSEEPLYDLRIYDPAGRLLCMEADAGTSYTATLTAGTYIIRASGSTCKVIVP